MAPFHHIANPAIPAGVLGGIRPGLPGRGAPFPPLSMQASWQRQLWLPFPELLWGGSNLPHLAGLTGLPMLGSWGSRAEPAKEALSPTALALGRAGTAGTVRCLGGGSGGRKEPPLPHHPTPFPPETREGEVHVGHMCQGGSLPPTPSCAVRKQRKQPWRWGCDTVPQSCLGCGQNLLKLTLTDGPRAPLSDTKPDNA